MYTQQAHVLIQVAKAAFGREPEFEELTPGQKDFHDLFLSKLARDMEAAAPPSASKM